jgi:hypothetical protein
MGISGQKVYVLEGRFVKLTQKAVGLHNFPQASELRRIAKESVVRCP